MTNLDQRLGALAAAAVLQRVRWGEHKVEVPLGRVVRVDHDEIVLKLDGGRWLVLATVESTVSLQASMRRWHRETESGTLLVGLIATAEVQQQILESPPERPDRRVRAAIIDSPHALWEDVAPPLIEILEQAAARRKAPPADVMTRLREREGDGPPEAAAPPPTESFQRIVFALCQAHDLVRLVRGEATLQLRGGGHLTVLAASGDATIDNPALAAALARIAAGLTDDDVQPALLVVNGPEDLVDRTAQVFGRSAKFGRVNTISATGVVRPVDSELSQLVRLAERWPHKIELVDELASGLSRSGGRRIDKDASAAGSARIGLIRGLLRVVPDLKLGWLEGTGAQLSRDARELQVRFVGPEGGGVEDAVGRWRLANLAARWTGHTVDLLLAGGDAGTWDRARRDLGSTAQGHVYHLSSDGKVRTKAGLLGPALATARALRKLSRRPAEERQCSLDELEKDLDRGSVEEFRAAVADAEFVTRLSAVPPWATRAMLALIAVMYALQLRWDGTDTLETTGAGSVRLGALTGEGLTWVVTHEPWRLLSAAFLHASWWHIGLNALALWVLGRRIEALLGPERLVLLFVGSCIGGSMLHEAFSLPGDIAVGSSTGILGLLAAQGALALFRRDLLPPRIRRLLWREAWMNGALIAGLSLLPFVGGLAHLGGAIAGFALVGSGLLTWGVTKPEPSAETPTLASTSLALRIGAGIAGAVAIGSVVIAVLVGQPWSDSASRRVRDTAFFEGALTVPVMGKVSASRDDDADPLTPRWEVRSGDVLRDGLEVHAIAIPWRTTAQAGETPDLERIAALYGGDTGGADALTWDLRMIGGEPAVQLISASTDRFVQKRWLVVRGGIVIDVRVRALSDAADALLSGTWDRIPAGVDAQGSAFTDELRAHPFTPLQALAEAEAGRADAAGTALLAAISLAANGDRDTARRRLDVAIGGDDAERLLALRLSQALQGQASVLLSGRALAHAPEAEKPLFRLLHAQALMLDRQFDEAANQATDDALTRASALWYAGRDDEAATSAMAWRAENSLNWIDGFATLIGRSLPPELETNLGWSAFLEADPERCIAATTRALKVDPDITFASYNLALCRLATGDQAGAREALAMAHMDATALGANRLRRSASLDFAGLVDRKTPGASELYNEFFADLDATPAAPSPGLDQDGAPHD